MELFQTINAVAWVLANILLAYISVAVVIFLLGYGIFFNPRATTAGKYIFQFVLSLLGVIILSVVGIFIDPSSGRSWFYYPTDVALWRPLVRVVIYAYVAYSITALTLVLGFRKWKPNLLETHEQDDMLKPKNDKLDTDVINLPKTD